MLVYIIEMKYIIYFVQSLPQISHSQNTPVAPPSPPPGDWMVAPLEVPILIWELM